MKNRGRNLGARLKNDRWHLNAWRCRVEQSMITNNVVHRCVACGFSRSYECKRIYINAMRARIPSSISFSLSRRRLLLGMWKDDGRRRRSRTQVGGIVMWPFKKGHQVRDVPSALKVEFNCWRKFRIQGRVHTISTVCPSQGHRHWDHGSYTVLVAFRRSKINHSFAHEEGVKYSLCAYKQRNVRVYYFHPCLCEYYLRNWIKRDICNVIKMIIDKGFLWARKIYVEGRKKKSVSFQSKIRSGD